MKTSLSTSRKTVKIRVKLKRKTKVDLENYGNERIRFVSMIFSDFVLCDCLNVVLFDVKK